MPKVESDVVVVCDCVGTVEIIQDGKRCCPLYHRPANHRRLFKLTNGHIQLAYSDSGRINWMHACEAGMCEKYTSVPTGHTHYIKKA